MNPVYEKLLKCYDCYKAKIDFAPKVAVVLGSGLGNFAKVVDVKAELPYSEIEGFPVSTVPGHAGKFIFGYINEIPVVLMQGRVHYYEGYPITDVVLPARLMKMMGAEVLFLTNASGGINPSFHAGSLMLIKDHVSIFAPNPLIGANEEELGPRFPDMSEPYDGLLRERAEKIANQLDIKVKHGVYTLFQGPYYESAAEIRMFKAAGSDAIGMSTVPETIVANYAGIKTLGIACITNMATGIRTGKHSHQEVVEIAERSSKKLCAWMEELLRQWNTVIKKN